MVPALLAQAYSEPLLMEEGFLQGMLQTLGDFRKASAHLQVPGECSVQPIEGVIRLGGTGVIPVFGPLTRGASLFERLILGVCDIDEVKYLVDLATMDPTIERVVLHFRSPGGTELGVIETSRAIQELRQEKPVIGFSDTQACSAAYWLMSQCDRNYITPSARVGSVGGYLLFRDESAALEQVGIKINAISVGKWKLAGAPFKAMTAEERAMFQEKCERLVGKFRETVLDNRTIAAEHLEGQTFHAEEAIANNLVDGVVNDLEELIPLLLES